MAMIWGAEPELALAIAFQPTCAGRPSGRPVGHAPSVNVVFPHNMRRAFSGDRQKLRAVFRRRFIGDDAPMFVRRAVKPSRRPHHGTERKRRARSCEGHARHSDAQEEVDVWMTAPPEEALSMQRAALNHRFEHEPGPDHAEPRTRFDVLVKTGEAFKLKDAIDRCAALGVTARFVQNRTLSRLGQERGANIA
jgi:hypothetical protein